MLPIISTNAHLEPELEQYLTQLKNSFYQGDIETCYSSRIVFATDNSIYQQIPKAIVFPRSTHDLIEITKLANQEAFRAIRFSARGGGTGTNGQALTSEIVVDISRYMKDILEINIEQGWVRVQAGIVKDALNDVLKPFGYFFSPELSTSNRATIGGMINTDASGQGSLRYGKTSDQVKSVLAVLADGSVLDTKPLAIEEIASLQGESLAIQGLKKAAAICKDNRALIEEIFPPLNRFLTGYDLKHAYQPEQHSFDITRLICGSEGTLAFISEAVLSISKLPGARVLVNIKYDSFDAALKSAPLLIEAHALSVETIDATVLNLAKNDIIWHSVASHITEVEGKTLAAINLVEFSEDSQLKIAPLLTSLCQTLNEKIENNELGIIGYQICHDEASINKIYAMRKKAVGLLGAMKGVAFAEDTCVPPEQLCNFIKEYRNLLDSHSLQYGMFGHVDSGVIHVRPALDLCDIEQERLVKTLSDSIVALVAKYGGLMWGEHGKGYRSQYGVDFWGERLFSELGKIKAAFDPFNQLNPGKICTPYGSDESLVKVEDPKRATFDRQIPSKTRESFRQVLECNGNGLCFNYEHSSPMCPSMKITDDRRHSPKGRASIIREWLRLLTKEGIDPLALEKALMSKTPSIFSIIQRYRYIFQKQNNDFSHEVMEVMNGCLACKACASLCPIKVNVPSFRARFIQLYHSRYPRPIKDMLVANIERLLPIMAKKPKLTNAALCHPFAKKLSQTALGLVDTPTLSVPTLAEQIKHKTKLHFNFAKMCALKPEDCENYVFILQDAFTSFYEAQLVVDFIHLIEKIDKKPILLPLTPNGKAQYIKGYLREFTKTASSTAKYLNELSVLNIPIVGLDPAAVLCYRDEYSEILADKRGCFSVLSAHEWLLTELKYTPKRELNAKDVWYLFSHCSEKTQLPTSQSEWSRIFAHFGAKLENVAVGCCGMAGIYGHEAKKAELSKGIYRLSWQNKLDALPKARCMATGYSCRSQVKRIEQTTLLHPIQVLLKYLL